MIPEHGRVAPVSFPELGPGRASPHSADLAVLADVDMTVAVELGRTLLRVREVLELAEGSVLALGRPVGAPADVLVNGQPLARGEVVVIDETLGVRITGLVEGR